MGLNLTVVSGIQQSTSVCNCNIDVYPSPLPLRFPAGDSALRGDFCPSMSVCRILRRQPLNIKHFSLLVSPLYITMYDCLTSSLSCWSLSLPLRCVAPDCFPLFVPGRVPSALPVASIHVQTFDPLVASLIVIKSVVPMVSPLALSLHVTLSPFIRMTRVRRTNIQIPRIHSMHVLHSGSFPVYRNYATDCTIVETKLHYRRFRIDGSELHRSYGTSWE